MPGTANGTYSAQGDLISVEGFADPRDGVVVTGPPVQVLLNGKPSPVTESTVAIFEGGGKHYINWVKNTPGQSAGNRYGLNDGKKMYWPGVGSVTLVLSRRDNGTPVVRALRLTLDDDGADAFEDMDESTLFRPQHVR